MAKEKKIVNYSIENIKAGETEGKDFDFFKFEYFAKDIEHLKKSHRHEFHAFIYVTAGSGSHIIDFEEYPLLVNRCFYIGYGQVHAWKLLKHVKGFVLLFTDDFYNAVYTGNKLIKSDSLLTGLNTYTDVPKEKFNDWNILFQQIEHEYISKHSDWKLIVCLLLKTIALRFKRESAGKKVISDKLKRKSDMILQYKDFINEFYIELKTPMDYANKLNITPNYLNAVCKEVTGKSAGQLIKERIVLEAKRLINHTQLTISEIAHKLGFDDKSHFGKYFKNFAGQSPDSFRKSAKQ
jgi:AraC family transcriptional activator of pobA